MRKYFSRLQWKLTLSYALVSASTVILLSGLLVLFVIAAQTLSVSRTFDSYYWSKTGFQENVPQLVKNPAALQSFLERVQQEGFQAEDLRDEYSNRSLDFANSLVRGAPIYVLDPHLNLLAAAPLSDPASLGKPLGITRINGESLENILEAAQVGDKNYSAQSLVFPNGVRLAAFPLRDSEQAPVSAIVIYMLRPRSFAVPENLEIYSVFFLVTMAIVLIVSLPVGAIFGWLASRGLRQRLSNLSYASHAWSKGDFSVHPRDASGDEIGDLTLILDHMSQQLQSLLSTRETITRMEERNRLARDLHDTIKQQTYAARMQLNAVKNLLPDKPAAALEHLDAALQLNRETQQELKLIIDELRPAALEVGGLEKAIIEYTDRWQEHTGIKIERMIECESGLPVVIEQALFRVLQEALSNISRHAAADQVILVLNCKPGQAFLSIQDNGRGFDPVQVGSHSFGLASMKQRLEEVGGKLTVETFPEKGTKVTAETSLAVEMGDHANHD